MIHELLKGVETRRETAANPPFDVAASVASYIALLDEDRAPTLESYLDRIPESRRESVYRGIDRELANRLPQGCDPFVLPRVEVVVQRGKSDPLTVGQRKGDPWVRLFAKLVPNEIRHEVVGEILARRQEQRAWETNRVQRAGAAVKILLDGIAQHVPLRVESERPVEQSPLVARAATAGLLSWRLCGPAMLGGLLFSSGPALAAGMLLVVAAFTSLAIVLLKAREPLPRSPARLVNATLAGTLVVLLTALTCGIAAIGSIALASILDAPWMAEIGVSATIFVTSICACFVTAAGWAPGPWYGSRLVRI